MLKQGQVPNNRYQIHAVLGQGGFGAVYKGWDDNVQRQGNTLVIKSVPAEICENCGEYYLSDEVVTDDFAVNRDICK